MMSSFAKVGIYDMRFRFHPSPLVSAGMDIKQDLSAVAAVTLGKDMTFRDYAQGAFRMRGIGKGQKVQVRDADRQGAQEGKVVVYSECLHCTAECLPCTPAVCCE